MAPRILLIDDQLDTVQLLAKVLTKRGCETRLTDDPRRAMEIAGEFRPDAICLDIGMPHIDGYTLAKSLRRLPQLPHCKIIAISGYPPDEERLNKAGIDRHMLKPISGAVLASAVHAAMGEVATVVSEPPAPTLQLPIWAVREKYNSTPVPGELKGAPLHVIAFDCQEFTNRYVHTRPAAELKLDFIGNERDLMSLVTDLQREGKVGLLVNPEPDGSHGRQYSIATLLDRIQKGPQ
jgi:CheY-like chemotaxis protein